MNPFDTEGFGEPVPELPPEYILQEIQRLQREGTQRRPAPPQIPRVNPPRENFGGTNPVPLTNIPPNIYDLPPKRPEPRPIPQLLPPSGDFGGTDPMQLNSVPPGIFDMPPNREQRMGLPPAPPQPTFQSELERLEKVASAREQALPQQPFRTGTGAGMDKFSPEVAAYLKNHPFGGNKKPSNLERAFRPPSPNGYTYGFGGQTTPGAEERIARALATVQPGSTPGGLTASQKRQLAVPIQKSGLQSALESFGTKEEKMLRGTRDYQKVGDRLIRPGSRTQAHIGPDGKVTLVGGERASSTDDLGKYISEVSDETTRRMKNVEGVIERKNAMKSKLQANRDIKIAENKLKKNPLASTGEPKSAAEAGIAAVMKGIQQNPALKFDNKSKEVLYQTGANEFMENKKLENELKGQEIVSQGYKDRDLRALRSQIIGAAVTNPDGSMKSGSALQQALESVPGVLAQSEGLMSGAVPQALPESNQPVSVTPQDAASAEVELTTSYPNILQGITGKSPRKAQEWLNDQYKGKPPEELKNLVKQYTEGKLTPKQIEQANVPGPIESYVDAWQPKDPKPDSFLSKYLKTVGSTAPGSYIQRHSGEAVQPPPGFQTKPLGNAHRAITGIPGIGPYLDISPQRLVDQLLGRE